MFFLNGPATPDIYTFCPTLSLHDALPICQILRLGRGHGRLSAPLHCPHRRLAARRWVRASRRACPVSASAIRQAVSADRRSEEHTSELQSLMRISYAVFCLQKKKT